MPFRPEQFPWAFSRTGRSRRHPHTGEAAGRSSRGLRNGREGRSGPLRSVHQGSDRPLSHGVRAAAGAAASVRRRRGIAHPDDHAWFQRPIRQSITPVAFVRFHARDHNLLAELPDWIGRDLFDLTDRFPSIRSLASMKRSSGSGPAKFFRIVMSPGYFCGGKAEMEEPGRRISRALHARTRIRPLLDRAQGGARCRRKDHHRHPSASRRFWLRAVLDHTVEWYLAWLRTLWPKLDQPVLYVATDDGALDFHSSRNFRLGTCEGSAAASLAPIS